MAVGAGWGKGLLPGLREAGTRVAGAALARL
jgi:hypothetical protein